MKVLADAGFTVAKRRALAGRIERAKQPVSEARRIVDRERRLLVGCVDVGDQIDLSDVQVIRATLIRRDGKLGAEHTDLLRRMDRLIARGELDRPGFEKLAGQVLAMPSTGPSRRAAKSAGTGPLLSFALRPKSARARHSFEQHIEELVNQLARHRGHNRRREK